jgi:hypothetical protein
MKVLGHKNYGSIPHLPGSRQGRDDVGCNAGQAKIATSDIRKPFRVIVQEKLDGSNVGVFRENGQLFALTRSGWLARDSRFLQHLVFDKYVAANRSRFLSVLNDGERLVGEWLLQAHGTRYEFSGKEPFVAFDIMVEHTRLVWKKFQDRIGSEFDTPVVISDGWPISTGEAMDRLGRHGFYGAIDLPEGAVWRVEKDDKVVFLCKYVRPDKIDGKYLPEPGGGTGPIWNVPPWNKWHPWNFI